MAWVVNCQPHDVPVLVAARLLKPLGHPAPNGVKYFATAEVLELVGDRTWLAKVTNAVNQYWQKKNQRKSDRFQEQFPRYTSASVGPINKPGGTEIR